MRCDHVLVGLDGPRIERAGISRSFTAFLFGLGIRPKSEAIPRVCIGVHSPDYPRQIGDVADVDCVRRSVGPTGVAPLHIGDSVNTGAVLYGTYTLVSQQVPQLLRSQRHIYTIIGSENIPSTAKVTCPRQEVSKNRDSQNIWQKLRGYHKLRTRIFRCLLPRASTYRMQNMSKQPYLSHTEAYDQCRTRTSPTFTPCFVGRMWLTLEDTEECGRTFRHIADVTGECDSLFHMCFLYYHGSVWGNKDVW